MKQFLLSLSLVVFIFLAFPLKGHTAKIIEETGEACHPNIRIAKEEALKDAKKKAIEYYVGTLLETRELIVNGKLMRKTIQTVALGQTKLAGKPVYEITTDSQKNITCAKVHAKFKLDKNSFSQANFGLKLILTKKDSSPGEELKVTLYSEKTCYPYLFSVDVLGNVYRLLPNKIEPHPRIKGKMTFPTPKMKKAGMTLAVYPLPNKKKVQEEEILFICLKEPDNALKALFPEAFAENIIDLSRQLRTIQVHENLAPKVEALATVLNQIGLQNYEMVDQFYLIKQTRQ